MKDLSEYSICVSKCKAVQKKEELERFDIALIAYQKGTER